MTDILRVQNLKVEFVLPHLRVKAVEDVSFRIGAQETVALVGESGSGKSTISQAIMGLLPRTAQISKGSMVFADPDKPGTRVDIAMLDRAGSEMRGIRGGRISMIFQEPMSSLSPLHTIGDQICEAVRLHRKVGAKEARELATEMLTLIGFPSPKQSLKTYPFELSGGLRQRAMIAMALICRPALLIADEPTTALDVTIQAQILRLIKELQTELKMSVLLITHDLGVVANMADRMVVVYDGRVVESGTTQDVFLNPGHPYTQSLLTAVPHFNMGPDERLSPLREIKPKTGSLLSEGKNDNASEKRGDRVPPAFSGVPSSDQEPVLKLRHLSKSFTTRKGNWLKAEKNLVHAVSDVSLNVHKGECVGLVGESGCGKTTLSKLIMRAMSPDEGSIQFRGENGQMTELVGLDEDQLHPYRKRIQFVFQDPFGSLNPRMTVQDIIAEPMLIHGIGDSSYRQKMVLELMDLVGLDPRFLNRYPHSFSGGQRQRIGIARALSLKPDLLIFDEPTSALDVSVQAQILNLLKDLQRDLGLTYLFISHNLAVIDYVADHIAVMCSGRIVESAPRDLLFKNPLHPYTQALFNAVPYADLDHLLDFNNIVDGKASDPARWPAPFTISPTQKPKMIQFAENHFVRAERSNFAEVAE
ncbi:ABC transporter ATP-binding protein [Thalassospira sp. MA62]|nr:ABC transporter ATP-binding protein [Thalassospira sp. MA62]